MLNEKVSHPPAKTLDISVLLVNKHLKDQFKTSQ